MIDMTKIIKMFQQQIETCRLIETRMVDQYVLADPESGQMLTTEHGIQPLQKQVGDIQRTTDRSKIEGLLAYVKEHNPDNFVAQRLVIMGWKKAARIQRQKAEANIKYLEEKT